MQNNTIPRPGLGSREAFAIVEAADPTVVHYHFQVAGTEMREQADDINVVFDRVARELGRPLGRTGLTFISAPSEPDC